MAHSYGPPIRLESAKQAAAAALAEARRNSWTMVVAVVDNAGELVYFEKMDDAQNGSVKVAVAKARSAALFKRPTKAFQDALTAAGDGLRILASTARCRSKAACRSSSTTGLSARLACRAAPASRTASARRPASARCSAGLMAYGTTRAPVTNRW